MYSTNYFFTFTAPLLVLWYATDLLFRLKIFRKIFQTNFWRYHFDFSFFEPLFAIGSTPTSCETIYNFFSVELRIETNWFQWIRKLWFRLNLFISEIGLQRRSYHESNYSQVMLNNFWPTEFWMNLNTSWFYNFFVVVFNFRMIVVQNNKNIFVNYAVSCCENLCLWYKDATTYRFAIFNNGDLPRPALKVPYYVWYRLRVNR